MVLFGHSDRHAMACDAGFRCVGNLLHSTRRQLPPEEQANQWIAEVGFTFEAAEAEQWRSAEDLCVKLCCANAKCVQINVCASLLNWDVCPCAVLQKMSSCLFVCTAQFALRNFAVFPSCSHSSILFWDRGHDHLHFWTKIDDSVNLKLLCYYSNLFGSQNAWQISWEI